MAIRARLLNWALNKVIRAGQRIGLEKTVVSGRSLNVSLEVPDTADRAWDGSLYNRGHLFVKGHANPIKVYSKQNLDSGEQSQVDMMDSEGEVSEHLELVSSAMYQEYQDQHLASELVNPTSQWRLILYVAIVAAVLAGIGALLTLVNTGVFG